MTISKPSYPTYGYDTFNKLQEVVDVLYENDLDLQGQINSGGGGGPGPVTTRHDLTLSSGYANRATYVPARTVRVGDEVHLESGLLTCPASFPANTYFTMATVHEDHRPTDGNNRTASAHIHRSTASGSEVELRPFLLRLLSTGQLQIWTPVLTPNVDFLILGQLQWSVV